MQKIKIFEKIGKCYYGHEKFQKNKRPRNYNGKNYRLNFIIQIIQRQKNTINKILKTHEEYV